MLSQYRLYYNLGNWMITRVDIYEVTDAEGNVSRTESEYQISAKQSYQDALAEMQTLTNGLNSPYGVRVL